MRRYLRTSVRESAKIFIYLSTQFNYTDIQNNTFQLKSKKTKYIKVISAQLGQFIQNSRIPYKNKLLEINNKI